MIHKSLKNLRKEISPTGLLLRAVDLLFYISKKTKDAKFHLELMSFLNDASKLEYSKSIPYRGPKPKPEKEEPNTLGEECVVELPKPDEELAPWMGKFKSRIKIWDRKFPYSTDGFIDTKGRFFQCDPLGHGRWTYDLFGCTEDYLICKCGWVKVWSYSRNENSENLSRLFIWGDKRPNSLQINKMVDWCNGQKIDLKKAFGYAYKEIFEK